MFDLAAERFHLHEFDLDEFQPKVMDSAAGNPGQLIEMCWRAKFVLVCIDTVAGFLA